MHSFGYKQKGFTLIEFSIVMIVTGLIIGGILFGRDLVEAAAIRKQLTQIQTISLATSAFIDKYKAIPGDMYASASQFGLSGGNAAGNSRDDGRIQGFNGNSPINMVRYEPVYFFGHLVEAGLLPKRFLSPDACVNPGGWILSGEGQYYQMTLNESAGMVAQTYQGNIWTYLGISDCTSHVFNGPNPHADAVGVITPMQAYSIDKKSDDGVPVTGRVLALEVVDLDNAMSTVVETAGECALLADGLEYNVLDTTNQCRLLMMVR